MAEADELWNGLSMEQQHEAMCIMFQPLLDRATAMKRALENIRELNKTQPDENGHRWANSDLIEQEIVAALPDPKIAEGTTNGIERIAAERKRQVEGEGWTPEHDNEHSAGEMAGAAACYALACTQHWAQEQAIASFWPWDKEWWKPSDDPIRNLEKSGALIAAEIDRRTREREAKPVKEIQKPEQM
ncbi:hypothetical protein [Epibacterium sp. Ofav1-8]|uniref:hypothetical protein n=1 Tax=Epibacterium sp. Ofav1-8 TaxID=2917735 RepID=UPI001EF52040|nr:hypothetical protein [Epibacterium sp. Ofav1-8]MCG7625575.1 hypothetical protein [Epibacterium sp. Ofav1-8]